MSSIVKSSREARLAVAGEQQPRCFDLAQGSHQVEQAVPVRAPRVDQLRVLPQECLESAAVASLDRLEGLHERFGSLAAGQRLNVAREVAP